MHVRYRDSREAVYAPDPKQSTFMERCPRIERVQRDDSR
jgi:hypothetical protein